MAQLLITMRSELAKRYAKDHAACDVLALLAEFKTVQVIGDTSFCTRIKIDDAEIPTLKTSLESNFIVEPDYVLKTPDTSFSSGSASALARHYRANPLPPLPDDDHMSIATPIDPLEPLPPLVTKKGDKPQP